MSSRGTRRATPDDAFTHNSDCRIDFQKGLFICIGPDGETITKRIVFTRSPKKKDLISIYEALRLAGYEATSVVPATLSFTPVRDPENKDNIRVYVPAVVSSSGQIGFLYDDGGKFAFTAFVAGSTKVYIPDINCNVVVDVIGHDVPPKEEFEKAINKLAKDLDFLGTYREVVLFLMLYPFVYVHFLRRPIVTVTGPFRSGKTTVLELVQEIVGRDAIMRGHFSLAGARGLLSYKHVILDDFGEGAVLEDPNIGILLEYHDRGTVAKVDDRLATKVFPMRGVLYLAGGYAINLLKLSSYLDRLFVIKVALSRNMMHTLNAMFNSIIKDADYYRWAFSRLYLYLHEYYLSLATRLDLPWRRDDLFTPDAINHLMLRALDNSKMPTLTVENMAQNAKKHAADVHMAIILQILRHLLRRRALGFDKAKNKVFLIDGKEVEFYHVQYVHRLEIPIQVGQGTESMTITETIGATKTKSRSLTISRPKLYASPSMVQAIIDMYTYLKDYFIVSAPDGKAYSVWVRADAVDEAIRWLIFTLQEHAPHYLDYFPTLADEVTRQAYEEVMKRLEGDKAKGNNGNNGTNNTVTGVR